MNKCKCKFITATYYIPNWFSQLISPQRVCMYSMGFDPWRASERCVGYLTPKERQCQHCREGLPEGRDWQRAKPKSLEDEREQSLMSR